MSVVEGLALEYAVNTASYYPDTAPDEVSAMVEELIVEAATNAALNEGAGDAMGESCWVQVRPFVDIGFSIQIYHVQKVAGRLINAEGDPIS